MVYFIIARVIMDISDFICFAIILCMLCSAVNLLRRLLDDNSEEGSDKTIAVLHFLLIIIFIFSSFFENIVQIGFLIKSVSSKGQRIPYLFDYKNYWFMLANLNK